VIIVTVEVVRPAICANHPRCVEQTIFGFSARLLRNWRAIE
jgi:hypothetical protein